MEKDDFIKLVENAFSKKSELGTAHGVRKLRKGRPNKRIIQFYSQKVGLHIPCESRLEAAHALYLEFDENITDYRSQPFKIRTPHFKYTPDFVIKDLHGFYDVREIKPKNRLLSEKVSVQLDKVAEYFHKNEIDFSLWTDEELYKEPAHSNREYLYKHTRFEFAEEILYAAKRYLLEHHIISEKLGELKTLLNDEFETQGLVEALIKQRFLKYDPRAKLSHLTPLSINGGVK
jgi:hypothetical protein